jgi:glycosyltransferase involved in cell wall biosynthesis
VRSRVSCPLDVLVEAARASDAIRCRSSPERPVEPADFASAFSAVVVAHQVANVISDALESIRPPTAPRQEVTLCDDGSTDALKAPDILHASPCVTPPNPAALAVAIWRLLRAEALRNRLGAGGHRLVLERLTADHMARSSRATYDELLR